MQFLDMQQNNNRNSDNSTTTVFTMLSLCSNTTSENILSNILMHSIPHVSNSSKGINGFYNPREQIKLLNFLLLAHQLIPI